MKKPPLLIFDALSRIFLTLKRIRQEQIRPFDVTLKQHWVLSSLESRGVMKPSEIAQALFCDRPTAAVIIRNLVKKGWVRQMVDPEDKRRMPVELTPEGREKLAEIAEAKPFESMSAKALLSCLDARERRELNRLLNKLYTHMQEQNDGDN